MESPTAFSDLAAGGSHAPGFLEFFAGGGMARLGLGEGWRCLAANDVDPKKCRAYRANFGGDDLLECSISSLNANSFPGCASSRAALAWASFPCQDLSLAGARAGLGGTRSGLFWEFWRIVQELEAAHRPVPILAIENVAGLLASRGGADFAAIVEALAARYWVGALVVDAAHWLPQSRPRLFIVCLHKAWTVRPDLAASGPVMPWHTRAITEGLKALGPLGRDSWVWWKASPPPLRQTSLAGLLLPDDAVSWNSEAATAKLVGMMDQRHLDKLAEARASGGRTAGTLYRRTRGAAGQRAEVRFDGTAGCLRTPAGGSSRQTVVVVAQGEVRTRLLAPREAARLMGIPDSYELPARANDALRLAGDGVAVPAVRWLNDQLFSPLAASLGPEFFGGQGRPAGQLTLSG